MTVPVTLHHRQWIDTKSAPHLRQFADVITKHRHIADALTFLRPVSHYVTENLDQGPIIFQDSFKVDPNDTLEKMKAKGQKLEADTLFKAMKMHLENKLEVRWRKVHIK